jgi:hypothetical protein
MATTMCRFAFGGRAMKQVAAFQRVTATVSWICRARKAMVGGLYAIFVPSEAVQADAPIESGTYDIPRLPVLELTSTAGNPRTASLLFRIVEHSNGGVRTLGRYPAAKSRRRACTVRTSKVAALDADLRMLDVLMLLACARSARFGRSNISARRTAPLSSSPDTGDGLTDSAKR